MNARQLQKVPMNIRRWWRDFSFLLLVAALTTYAKVPMNVRRTIRQVINALKRCCLLSPCGKQTETT